MCIDRAAGLAGRLDLDAELARLDAVVRILAAHDEIGVPVMISVLHERAGMIGEARGEHVRNDSRHRRGPQDFIEPAEPLARQRRIHVEEEIVDILHLEFEILEAKLERQFGGDIELADFDDRPFHRHLWNRNPSRNTFAV